MATIAPTIETLGIGKLRVTWAAMGTGDDGAPFSGATKYPDKSVGVEGTITSVDIEGRTKPSESWRVLNDSRGEGNALNFTLADIRQVLENVNEIRPKVTTGTDVKVVLTLG